MTQHWKIADLPWSELAPAQVDVELLETVKTAAIVEANSADYVTYLHNVFGDDAVFKGAADVWGIEEAQHGAALGRWAERIDPTFDFAASLAHFRAGYRLPLHTTQSVRGSRAGELVARCVVEAGTCSFYSALRDSTREPVLRQICHHIAQDEAAHYRLFQTHLRRYLAGQQLGFWARLRVALGRIQETSDDELAYAYFSANHAGRDVRVYERTACASAYWRRAMARYQRRHVQSAVHMVLAAVDLRPGRGWVRWGVAGVWRLLQWRLQRLRRMPA
jgi:rubrerythrin